MSLTHRSYTVGCICPMGVELAPVKAMLDHIHPSLPSQRDQNSYILGDMSGHNMVIAILPEIGTNPAATAAIQLLNDFPSIRFGLLVGIGGGVPGGEDDEQDIRLGDVVISKPTASSGGVVQYDLGKYSTAGGFERTGVLNKPPPLLRSSVESLKADHLMKGSRVPQYLLEMLQQFPAMEEEYAYPGTQHDQLFRADYPHPGGKDCRNCDMQQTVDRDARRNTNPKFHYGTIGSANSVVKDAGLREELRRSLQILCVEMEAAGLMDSFPCLVIRGICDYADSHKNKRWQPYAAATAAAYMKELLSIIPPKDVTNVAPAAEVVQTPKYERGINLFDAPDIPDELFVGRDVEIQQMEKILLPGSDSSLRKILVLGGMGGIGKTQLSIAYAKRHVNAYSSVFWLNSTSELTLKGSFRQLAHRILAPETVDQLDDDRLWIEISNWLCELDNNRWLLIFDNHDNPDEYNITQYYPTVVHGSVIVTTRVPNRLNGREIHLRSLSLEEDSLQILSTRSGREGINSDVGARDLAHRLDGHPLALATAGAYLKESSFSFSKYLQQYEAQWEAVTSIEELADYPTRTLHTTWDLSFNRIQQENQMAAEFLRFLAYLDHRDIWYELFRRHQDESTPLWFTHLTGDEASFEKVMRILVRYCLVEAHYQAGSYSIHVCVHDWILNGLNRQISPDHYWLAFDCVAGHVRNEEVHSLSSIRHQRITAHTGRLVHDYFREVSERQDYVRVRLQEIAYLAELLHQQVQYKAAERMYQQALQGKEKVLGKEHISTLGTVINLGSLYSYQGKLDEAETMYQRALQGYEKVLGKEHISTLDTVHNLGILYISQGKLDDAEKIYQRAFQGKEKVLGKEHISTLDTVNSLGILYKSQGKLDEAEKMYQRAFQGKEKVLGKEHISTLNTVNNLGNLYSGQGKLDKAEKMYQRALQGYEKVLGKEHISTLDTVHNLGNLYISQGKLDDAEKMYQRAFQGKEKVLGKEHISTLDTVNNLGILYKSQGKLDKAEKMYQRAFQGYEKVLGKEHTSTLNTVNNLGNLYSGQGKLDEAEKMYQRALQGKEKVLGKEHISTLDTVHNLGILYQDQGKLDDAGKMYQRALQGKEKVLGKEHISTLGTVNNLGNLYSRQGKLDEAETMYQRALEGYEKTVGPELVSTYVPALNTCWNLGQLRNVLERPDKAKEMCQRALVGFQKVLGPSHERCKELESEIKSINQKSSDR